MSIYEEFLLEIQQLNVEAIFGVAQLLGVEIWETPDTAAPATTSAKEARHSVPRDGSVILEEMCNAYGKMNRFQRRKILKTIAAASEEK